nr:hypothetical protein [Tanacetum cinerariifolium]
MGFGRKWCAWIRGCLESSVISILVNGSLTDEFKIRRGLRQRDPLSPFLFILAMEGLHMLISHAIRSSQLHVFKLVMGMLLFPIFFMLMTLFFLEIGMLMGVGVPIGEITKMANIIGCEASTIPFVYLGVPVGANMSRIGSYKELIDKFKTRLSRWKVKTLSVGGRLTLLKSVLGSIAIYYMSIFKNPIAVIKEIKAIRNQFFLGADTDENKMMWIKWNKVMASKKEGDQNPESVVANRLNLAPNAPFLRRNPRGEAEKDQWVALLSLLETHVSSNQRDSSIGPRIENLFEFNSSFMIQGSEGLERVVCATEVINQGHLVLGRPAHEIIIHIDRLANIFRYICK